ncbi:MAG: hypothetical protein ACK4MD_02685, partial [Demequina sp.]
IAWVAIAAIAAYLIMNLADTFVGSRKKQRDALKRALRDTTAAQEQTASHLAEIDRRLTTIEKTLTDIP